MPLTLWAAGEDIGTKRNSWLRALEKSRGGEEIASMQGL